MYNTDDLLLGRLISKKLPAETSYIIWENPHKTENLTVNQYLDKHRLRGYVLNTDRLSNSGKLWILQTVPENPAPLYTVLQRTQISDSLEKLLDWAR